MYRNDFYYKYYLFRLHFSDSVYVISQKLLFQIIRFVLKDNYVFYCHFINA